MQRIRFDRERTQTIAESLAQIVNTCDLSSVEIAYALASVLRGLGEAMYDKDDYSYEAVLEDYRESPTWAGALIVHADQIHVIREMLITRSASTETKVVGEE